MTSESANTKSGQIDIDFFELSGKLALVTGASSGLGLHFATRLAEAGCTVIIAARRKEKLDALASLLNQNGHTAHAITLDVADQTTSAKALNAVYENIGTPDILINNAGIAKPDRFLDAPANDTNDVFNVNQTSVWHISQHVCKQMIATEKSGSVINIASILGLDVLPGVGSYAVSKAAVVQMTKVMALELARYNIRVNAIAPGYFDTEINQGFLDSDAGQKIIKRVPFRRVGNLDDLTGLLYLLASEKNAYMTGAVIPVDGGHLVAGLG